MIRIGLINWLIEKKKTPTILDVSNEIDNEITVSTSPHHLYHSYVINQKDLKLSDSGRLYIDLPIKSNIKKLSKKLNKLTKEFGGFDVESYYRNSHRKTWIDRFNRYIGTKIENPFSISFTIRSDAINEFSNRGVFLVQCENAKCEILIPSEIKVNLNDFSIIKKKQTH